MDDDLKQRLEKAVTEVEATIAGANATTEVVRLHKKLVYTSPQHLELAINVYSKLILAYITVKFVVGYSITAIKYRDNDVIETSVVVKSKHCEIKTKIADLI